MKEKKKEVRGLWGCWRLEKESSGWFVEDEGDEGAEGWRLKVEGWRLKVEDERKMGAIWWRLRPVQKMVKKLFSNKSREDEGELVGVLAKAKGGVLGSFSI